MLWILFFIFGASIGSFTQVVATRLNVAPISKTRSKCLSCGEALRVSDLIPIFSYLWLRGKCRYCKSSYGVSALLVELLYGLVFVLLYQFVLYGAGPVAGFFYLSYYTLLFIVLGVVALYDMAHTYLPNYYLIAYIGLTLLMLMFRIVGGGGLLDVAAPFVVAAPFLLIWMVSKGRALGFGDIILYFGVGAFFGIAQGLAVFLLSIWLGTLYAIMVYVQKRNRKQEIAFVPFIVIAFLVVLFTDLDIFSIASFFA